MPIPTTASAINLDGVSVWIDVPLADLIPRIPLDGRRPLAANRPELERLYAARVDAYRMAHIRITASRMSSAAVAERILDALHQLPPFFERSVATD